MKKLIYGIITGGVVAGGALLAVLSTAGTARADEANTPETGLSTVSTFSPSVVDETVYVFLNADGSVKKTISSDWTKNDLGVDTYTKTEGKVATPITIAISYYLDGKKVSADEIRGRSGHVKIRYDYTNTERVNGIYMPYAVLSGAVLSNEKFSNVSVANGRLLNDGARTAVVGITLPGMRENLGVAVDLPEYFEIEADVKDFKMEMTATIATSKIFAELDTSALDSVDSLSGSLNTLADSMVQLMDGSMALRDGLATLNSSTGILAEGVGQLRAGSLKLVDGTKDLEAGAYQLLDGAKKLDTGVDQTIAGVTGLVDKLGELDENSATIINNIQGAINKILASFNIENITVANFSEKIKETAKRLVAAGKAEEATKLQKAAEEYGPQLMLYQGVLNYVNGSSAIAKAAQKTDLSELKVGSTQIVNGLEQLYSGSKELATGMASLDAGISNLSSNVPALTEGVAKLADGSNALSSGLSQFNEQGVQKLIALYNGDVKALVSRVKNMVSVAKNSNSNAKYIYRTPEI
ncbi:hypothetical protein IJ103_03245 [Candidatus Saccharibacteria bacterium]|nr:hypothetical protein [Candidatus Saccharibacteria bacterium]